MQYAIAASHEALKDSEWQPVSELEKEMTVSFLLSPVTDLPLTLRIGSLPWLWHWQL